MKHFIEIQLRVISLCLFLLCFICIELAHSVEEIIYSPGNKNKMEIWISDVNGYNSRRLFSPPIFLNEISIQRGDRYILCIGAGDDNIERGYDVYLFDTKQLNKGRKDLTYGRFSVVSDAAISINGDVVFANTIYNEYSDGIYLIPKYEIHEPIPNAEKLYDGFAGYVDWAPNGRDVTFSNKEGIFLLNVSTKEVSKILEYGLRPVFSLDGTKIAFIKHTPKQDKPKGYKEIGVVSLQEPQNVKILEKTKTDLFLNYITWTPDGKSVAYSLLDVKFGVPGGAGWFNAVWEFTNFTVSVEDSKVQPIFKNFDGGVRVWEYTNKSFPLTPVAKLTTTWGKLKRETGKGEKNE